jgi:hypothetical protein
MHVEEVLKIAKERKVKTKECISKIIENIHKKIVYYAKLKQETCVYTIPPIINDTPLYEMGIIIKDVFKILDSEGYVVTAYDSGRLEIFWNEKLVEQKVKSDTIIVNRQKQKIKIKKKENETFNFLSNPKKIKADEDKNFDEKLDEQVQKILKEKEKIQNRYKKLVN